jgi:hypothetical protein
MAQTTANLHCLPDLVPFRRTGNCDSVPRIHSPVVARKMAAATTRDLEWSVKYTIPKNNCTSRRRKKPMGLERGRLEALAFLYFDKNSAAISLNDYSARDFFPKSFGQPPRLPIALSGKFHFGIGRIGCSDCFERIVSAAVGVLGNMRRCHRLPGGTRGKTRGVIFFCFTGRCMSRQGSSAYFCHLEYPSPNPCLASFDGFARSVVFRIGALK